jgi:hypothetical protein
VVSSEAQTSGLPEQRRPGVDGGSSSQWHTIGYAHLEAEVLFYNKLRCKVDIIAPTGLYAAVNQESYNSIIILRDLKDEGELPLCWPSCSYQRAVTFCDKTTKATRSMVEDRSSLVASRPR